MQTKATTVHEYLTQLPDDRREALEAVRRIILENLDDGYEEGIQYGMIGYYVPHRIYPAGYHCDPKQPLPFASLASQKNHMALYLMCSYGDEQYASWLREAWTKAGKKLDMGKSCIRFKRLEDVPLEVVGEAVRRVPAQKFIAFYESTLGTGSGAKRAGGKQAGTRPKTKAKAKQTARQKKTVRAEPTGTGRTAGKKVAGKKVAGKKKG